MHLFAKIFQGINQIKLPDSYILCHNCFNILTPPIYSRSDGVNLCQKCYDTSGIWSWFFYSFTRNEYLEIILENLKYSCSSHMTSSHHFIDTFENVKKHEKHCNPKVNCTYCNSTSISGDMIVEHLVSLHPEICLKIIRDTPTVNIKLWMPFKHEKMYIVDIVGTIFIVVIKFSTKNLLITIAKQFPDYENSLFANTRNDMYVLQYFNDAIEIKVSGKTCNMLDYFEKADSSSNVQLTIPLQQANEKEIDLTICFNGYEVVQSRLFDECPICLNSLKEELYQCTNGHNVCTECKVKINICAICRLPLNDTKVRLRHVFSNIRFPCPNSSLGCLHTVKSIDLDYHMDVCAYAPVQCVECTNEVARCKMNEHLWHAHDECVYKVFPLVRLLLNDSLLPVKMYYRFKEHLFRLTITMIKNKTGPQVIGFNVQLMYQKDNTLSDKYRYELHMKRHPDDVMAVYKVSNICQDMFNDKFSSIMKWRIYEELGKDANIVMYVFDVK